MMLWMYSTRYWYLIFSHWSAVIWYNSYMTENMIVFLVNNIITINRKVMNTVLNAVK